MPSSAIAHIEYNRERERLTVTFVTGRIYEYVDVPATLLHRTAEMSRYFARSYEYAKTLKPKPTKR